MRTTRVFLSLLVFLLVMGAFASMALNSYGITLMSYACLGISLLFLYELVFLLPMRASINSSERKIIALELLLLGAIGVLYFLQGLVVDIPFSDVVISVLLTGLLGINAYSWFLTWTSAKAAPGKLKLGVSFYFGGLFLAWTAYMLFRFQNPLSFVFTLGACSCLIGFVIAGWWKGNVVVNGIETSARQSIARFHNKSAIQFIILMLIIGYLSLSSLDLLPPLYSGSLPSGYRHVVSRSVNTNSSSAHPKEFEAAYKKFIEGK